MPGATSHVKQESPCGGCGKTGREGFASPFFSSVMSAAPADEVKKDAPPVSEAAQDAADLFGDLKKKKSSKKKKIPVDFDLGGVRARAY